MESLSRLTKEVFLIGRWLQCASIKLGTKAPVPIINNEVEASLDKYEDARAEAPAVRLAVIELPSNIAFG